MSENAQALHAEIAQLREQLGRTTRDLRRAVDESHALYLTSMDISSQLDLNSALSSVLRRTMALVRADMGFVGLVENASGNVTVAAESHFSPSLLGTRFRPGEDVIGAVMVSELAEHIEDYPSYSSRSPKLMNYAISVAAVTPLRWQGKIIGVLALFREAKPSFSLDELDSLQHIIVQAAIAINNAQLFALERARNQRLNTLYQAVTRITSSLDLESVLQAALDAMTAALQVALCSIYELAPQGRLNLLISRLTGVTRSSPTQGDAHALRLSRATRHFVEAGHWVAFQQDDPFCAPYMVDFMTVHHIDGVLLVPVTLGMRAIGLVVLGVSADLYEFNMADIDIAQALAAHIGIAIRHAQLHHQLQAQRVNEQAVLLRLTRHLIETTHQREVAEVAVQAAADAFGSRLVHLALSEPGGFRTRAAIGYDLTLLESTVWAPGQESSIGYAALRREVILSNDTFIETRFTIPTALTRFGVRALLVLPMIFESRILGVLSIGQLSPYSFTADDLQLASLLVNQIAVALERARLFEETQAQNVALETRIAQRLKDIQAEKERTETIFQATGEALIVCDLNGVIERVNRAFENHHNVQVGDIIGQRCKDVLGADPLGKVSLAEPVWHGEFKISRRDGTLYDAAVTVSVMTETSGQRVGTVISLRDISNLKELDRMKDRFISSVSHELRTPLANIKLYQHLLLNGLEGRREQYMTTLNRETERLQRLIEDLLMLSRLDTDTAQPNLRETDLNAVVRTLIEDRWRLVESKNLSLKHALCDGALYAMADEGLINQAVNNLLSNAINYTPAGGVITITTARQADSSGKVWGVICVADTGMGMTPEDQMRLFDRFYRGTAARATGSAGTGLGMSIVREVMARHQGTISVDSTPGHGSTFNLTIPLISA
jgi:PAS domain S-box-containing protein